MRSHSIRIRQFGANLLLLAAGVVAALGQGGKAEPRRIQFPAGKSGTILTGTLAGGQEMEYVFASRKQQTVTIQNANGRFEVRVFSEQRALDTGFTRMRSMSVVLPETGDYLLFVRKTSNRCRIERFSFSVNIK